MTCQHQPNLPQCPAQIRTDTAGTTPSSGHTGQACRQHVIGGSQADRGDLGCVAGGGGQLQESQVIVHGVGIPARVSDSLWSQEEAMLDGGSLRPPKSPHDPACSLPHSPVQWTLSAQAQRWMIGRTHPGPRCGGQGCSERGRAQ